MEKRQKWNDAKGNLPEEETETLLRELDDAIEKTFEFRNVLIETDRAVEFCRHVSYLTAFSVIIILVEFHNVNVYAPTEKIKKLDIASGIDIALEKETKFMYMNNVKMNKDAPYRALYKSFMEIAEQNRIVKDLCGSSEKAQERALKQIKEYFETVRYGCYQDANGNAEEGFAEIVMQIALKCSKNE